MAHKKLMLRINFFFFLRNRFFFKMYESIFEMGVWLDSRDREWGSVCVSVAHGRRGEPPPHGVAMAIIDFFLIKITSSSIGDFPLP